MQAVAREAESGSKYSAAAEYNLRTIAPYTRLMLAGMIADMMLEHMTLTMRSDVYDPDPTIVERDLIQFERRMQVLFLEGQIMVTQDTYTAQILLFFTKPSVIFSQKHAVLFAMPARENREAYYEPLERTLPAARASEGDFIAVHE